MSDAIERGLVRFEENGVGVQACLVGLNGSDDEEMVITAALLSRPWEVRRGRWWGVQRTGAARVVRG